MGRVDLSGYVDVAARIVEFRSKHPEGSLQPADLNQPFTVQTIGEQTFIVVVAAAYRTPDDSRPGIGMAYESFPGQTPYTRGSELQNAETSAWGRAIVAALAADTRAGVASADEIRNRQAEHDEGYHTDEARRNVIANARNAINSADTVEALDRIAERIAQLERNGLSAEDAAVLRGVLRDRHAAIKPPCPADTEQPVEPEPKPEEVRDWALEPARTEAELRDVLTKLRKEHPHVLDAVLMNGTGDEEQLGRLLQGRIHEFADAVVDGTVMVTERQHRTMHALWRDLGYSGPENRDNRLRVTSRVIGRDVASSAELTGTEADAVIDALKVRKRQGKELVSA